MASWLVELHHINKMAAYQFKQPDVDTCSLAVDKIEKVGNQRRTQQETFKLMKKILMKIT